MADRHKTTVHDNVTAQVCTQHIPVLLEGASVRFLIEIQRGRTPQYNISRVIFMHFVFTEKIDGAPKKHYLLLF